MSSTVNKKTQAKENRRKRVRARIIGSAARPRLNIYRSLNHIYAQLIDDAVGKTLVFASDLELKIKKGVKKVDKAQEVGTLIAQKAVALKITNVVFDRAGYKYHGRVKAVADSARKGGLIF